MVMASEVRSAAHPTWVIVADSSGARVLYDGVVSSSSPADIAHVPRKDAQIYFHSKTMMYLLRLGRLALIHPLKLFQFAAKTATSIPVVPPSLRNIRLIHLTVVSVVIV